MVNDPHHDSPAELLAAATSASRLTRAARHGFWFPLVVFGLLVICAAPLYLFNVPVCLHGGAVCLVVIHGDAVPAGSLGISLYWAIAASLGYAVTLGFYLLRARRVGVAGRIWPYLVVGLVLLAVTVLATPEVSRHIMHGSLLNMPGDVGIRGMTPLLALALGLFVLARLERSVPLAGFAVLFLVVALISNLYDVENQTPLIGWTPSAAWMWVPNLWLAGFTLLLGGLGFGLTSVRRNRARILSAQGQPT
ncbi:hypothetical protein [Streptacidiphilus fuscans]|uniref:Uncharacterized protein n=1 Tax=Streptacidiphilus fuscans TaxID=2789292 RepID=A0A931BD68_9ACTN|nr:hypothetical protein [Streptacidiphilus fuscans]MBF9072053.1 hypothetical protein [Streptacidiphilus fuscans]